MGALGAGIATGTALFLYAILKQLCLWRATGVSALHSGVVRPYAVMVVITAGLVILRLRWGGEVLAVVAAVILALAVVTWLARSTLSFSETFPEIARWPWLKRVLG
jgi:hypothetical protein